MRRRAWWVLVAISCVLALVAFWWWLSVDETRSPGATSRSVPASADPALPSLPEIERSSVEPAEVTRNEEEPGPLEVAGGSRVLEEPVHFVFGSNDRTAMFGGVMDVVYLDPERNECTRTVVVPASGQLDVAIPVGSRLRRASMA